MNAEELLASYEDGRRSFINIGFQEGMDLSGVDLSSVDPDGRHK